MFDVNAVSKDVRRSLEISLNSTQCAQVWTAPKDAESRAAVMAVNKKSTW